MKFGETLLDLQVEAWREYYLDYRALKALLKPCKKLSTEDANYDDKLTAISDAFLSALDTQLSRVNTFFAEKQGEAAELLWAQQDAEPQDGKTERK
jgi:SPX domain protein involved in polyphosphate accumulation